MRRDQADRYCGKLVAVTFRSDWFNDAMCSWVFEEEEYIGVLEHCPYEGQEMCYQLTSTDRLSTDRACWSANRMRRVREL